MTIIQLKQLIESGDMNKCKSLFDSYCNVNTWNDISRRSPLQEYDPHKHLVKDTTKRLDKYVKGDNGEYNDVIKVSRIPLPLQKKIVQTAAAFLGIPTIEAATANDKQEDMISVINKTWTSNKLDYKFFSIAELTMSERHCAELWYTVETDEAYWDDEPITSKFKLSVKILANSLGDTLHPLFDEYGNMIAFGRGYKVKNEQEKEINHFDIYTDEFIYYTKNDAGVWLYSNGTEYTEGIKSIPNVIKKIPVIYYYQPKVEWDDVQDLIDRLEKKISNHADTNDYFDSPIVKLQGKVLGFANKGESGKMLEMEGGADAGYLTWDTLPESMKMEMERLYNDIFKFTNTPDISFEKMSALGVFSGIAIKMFFVDAHLKAMHKSILFGEGLQRRINYLKAALNIISNGALRAALSLDIKPKFTFFMPANDSETLDNLNKAVTAGIISKETAIGLNPLVSDPDEELKRITQEKEAQQKLVIPIKPLPAEQN